MYVPASFRIDDPEKLSAFMDAYGFATLITCDNNVPYATHLPMRNIREGGVCTRLYSHMARANPQWRHFDQQIEVLTVFAGPHAYVSPSWYKTEPSVPTWNYLAVHAYGVATIIEDRCQIASMLDETIRFFEQTFDQPWSGDLPEEYRNKMIDSIVAFEVRIIRMEGKFKLGQNRSAADCQGVYDALAKSERETDRELSEWMVVQGLVSRD